MCGITGIVDFAGVDRAAAEPRLAAALARLAPRGPDGEGSWFGPRCAFAHRRLAIVDLGPGGAQPMRRGDLVITYNGMIYNYRALRDELRAEGHDFTSDSDTEMLLAGWRQWGAALLPRLEGMFAFAIWDERTGELVLARDRFGKKPLLFRHDGRRLAFASELRALQRACGGGGEIDPAALRLYFALRYLPEPYAILKGVAKLPPGHLARFRQSGLAVSRWYDAAGVALPATDRPATDRTADDRPAIASPAEAATEIAARIDRAVADRLVADVPVGAFLSGGIDSAIVVSSMTRAAARVRTFTVGFEGASDYYEERPAARSMARHLGTEHTEIAVTADETRDVIDAVFDGLDEPFADSSAIPTYLVARETRRHVTVALSGDGADEVFGGYRKYQGELQAARYRRLPGWLRRGLVEPLARHLPEGKDRPILEAARRFRRFAAHAGKDTAGRHAGWARLIGEDDLDRLFADEGASPTQSVEGLVAGLHASAAANGDDPINAMLAVDIALVLPGDMLVKVDRMSMAHGLEVRCPFLDHRVVEYAAAMPGGYKLVPGAGKKILREAFRDRLPDEVFNRPKKGFEVPLADWLVGPLADLTRRAIDPGRLARQGLFRPELPARWLASLEARRRDTSWELWTLIAFQAWCERNGAEAMAA